MNVNKKELSKSELFKSKYYINQIKADLYALENELNKEDRYIDVIPYIQKLNSICWNSTDLKKIIYGV